ncbi:tetratricopeptide repeat-containing diguanylate cyclase [Vibrio sp. LaRot3]|uniref:tetratricopeptide repeat-containing diguanylate cyclase n=1 Tax=Vibrio sp. LaRot3 TaxID=2998829 RepID=UPI0022CDE330|nr:diguanylate cyclase [Vibrio sp. LaRot3]MDA0147810.1 diguanylate cyclase [Vibrio sp. LaRot3]
MSSQSYYSKASTQALEVLTGLHGNRNVVAVQQAQQKIIQIVEETAEELSPVFHQFLEATLSYRQGDYKVAIEQYEALLGAIEKPDEFVLYPYVCIYLATIYSRLGQTFLSQHYFTLAEKNLSDSDAKLVLFLNVNLGDIYLQLSEWDKALEHSLKAVNVGQKSDNQETFALAMVNAGLAYAKQGMHTEAEEILQRAQLFTEQHGLDHSHTYVKLYQAQWQETLGDAAATQAAYQTAFGYIKKIGDAFFQIEFFEAYANFLYQSGQYSNAISFCRQIFMSPMLQSHSHSLLKLYRVMSDSCHQVGDLAQENKYLRLIQSLLDKELVTRKKNEVEYINKVVRYAESENRYKQSLLVQDRLAGLSELGQLISCSRESEQDFLKIFNAINQVLPISAFGLSFYDKAKNELEYRYMVEEGKFYDPFTVSCDSVCRIGVYSAVNRKTVRLDTSSRAEVNQYLDVQCHDEDVWLHHDEEEQPLASVITTPVLFHDELLGVMTVQRNRGYEYNQAHEQLVEQVASYLAVAISHDKQTIELENQNQYLEQIYHTDHLTGLKNHYGLLQWLGENHQPKPDCALLVALDGFKRFNAEHGRQAGDEALAECTRLLKDSITSDLHLFRTHSDQFLVLGVQLDKQQALKIGHQIRTTIKQYFTMMYGDGEKTVLTSTIGIAFFASDSSSAQYEQQLSYLETTMHAAKQRRCDGVFCVTGTM